MIGCYSVFSIQFDPLWKYVSALANIVLRPKLHVPLLPVFQGARIVLFIIFFFFNIAFKIDKIIDLRLCFYKIVSKINTTTKQSFTLKKPPSTPCKNLIGPNSMFLNFSLSKFGAQYSTSFGLSKNFSKPL